MKNKSFEKIKQQWESNPVETLLIGSFVATAVAKLIDAVSGARSRRAYAKQIDRKFRRNR